MEKKVQFCIEAMTRNRRASLTESIEAVTIQMKAVTFQMNDCFFGFAE